MNSVANKTSLIPRKNEENINFLKISHAFLCEAGNRNPPMLRHPVYMSGTYTSIVKQDEIHLSKTKIKVPFCSE